MYKNTQNGKIVTSAELNEKTKKDKRIIMTGFVQGNLFSELYSNTYMYVLPSDLEGMPISLLEAMSFGRRCLVSDIPENKEACGDHAMYFKKSDVADLEEKLREAISNPDAFKTEYEIMNYCYNRFNWNQVTSASVRLYIDAIINVERIDKV